MLALTMVSPGELGKVVIFLLTLSILVVLHEYGHFLVARRNGVQVNEFACGFGPKIFSWTSPRSGTMYSLRALPIGGYCAMEGEDNKTSEAEQAREFRERGQVEIGTTYVKYGPGGVPQHSPTNANFQSKSPWARLAIVAAGPVANFILAFIILLISGFAFGVQSDTPVSVVGPVIAGSAAEHMGLQFGDKIVAINGAAVKNGDDLLKLVHGSLHKKIAVTYERKGASTTVGGVPQPCPVQVGSNKGCLGFSPQVAYVREGFFATIAASGTTYVNLVDGEFQSLGLIVTHFTQYASQIRGPIGIGQAAVQVQDYGWPYYFSLAALLSFALGFFNLLPLPALDGGRGAFIIAELLRGKPVDPEKEAMVHIAGFAVLMVLMLVIAFHDVSRIVSGGGGLN